jgi:hypothetical protein
MPNIVLAFEAVPSFNTARRSAYEESVKNSSKSIIYSCQD